MGIFGFYYLRTHSKSPKYLQNQVTDLKHALDDQKKLTRIANGKMNKAKQLPQIDYEGNLDDADSVGKLIKEILPEVKGMLPKELKQYVDSPALVNLGIELYKKNPKLGTTLLQKFIKTKSNKGKSETVEVDGVGIPEWDPTKAV